ncbi:MAG: FtsH protease activity modulator HflK [Stappiaceae bacterium]
MPWSNQSGNGGGPWGGGGGNNNGPWGGGPQRGGGGGGSNPPDLEELLKRSQDKLKTVLPGGGAGGLGAKGIIFAVIVALAIWAFTGFYRVQPGEQAVELVFGDIVGLTGPGLNYNFPYPIGSVEVANTAQLRETTVGMQEFATNSGVQSRDVAEESLMLTGDENIVDVDFKVLWNINDPEKYLFNIQNPTGTVKAVSESAMREVIGESNIDSILTENRAPIQIAVQELMQKTLDDYGAGILVTEVQMQKVDPPQTVIGAFRDVQAARADQERIQNQAQTYANRVVPEARGEAARVTEGANAYKEQTVAEATGEAERFKKIYEQYKLAPDVTRERMYLETIEKVLGSTNKVILDNKNGGSGVVPYLPLGELTRKPADAGGAAK